MVKECWKLMCNQLHGQLVGPNKKEITEEEIEKERIRIRDEARSPPPSAVSTHLLSDISHVACANIETTCA